jgi:hypothetical protein
MAKSRHQPQLGVDGVDVAHLGAGCGEGWGSAIHGPEHPARAEATTARAATAHFSRTESSEHCYNAFRARLIRELHWNQRPAFGVGAWYLLYCGRCRLETLHKSPLMSRLGRFSEGR